MKKQFNEELYLGWIEGISRKCKTHEQNRFFEFFRIHRAFVNSDFFQTGDF